MASLIQLALMARSRVEMVFCKVNDGDQMLTIPSLLTEMYFRSRGIYSSRLIMSRWGVDVDFLPFSSKM